MPHRVFNFGRRVAPLHKVIPVPLDHVADAFDLNNIRPDAKYHC